MDKFNDLKLFVDRRFFTNTYLLYKNNKCVVIDPSINDDKIISFLQQHNLKLVGIILTHAHYDHIGNSFTLAKQHDVKIYISKYE
jgi:glyoxylase-like metal-dependent hydrolase (beta-lactamase superfamily II)